MRRVTFDLDLDRENIQPKTVVKSKFKIGDIVWYKIDVRSTRAWLEGKVVGVNSPNTSYDDVGGAVRLAIRNQLKLRVMERDDFIYPNVETQQELTISLDYREKVLVFILQDKLRV